MDFNFLFRYTNKQRKGLYVLIVLLITIHLLLRFQEKVFFYFEPKELHEIDSIVNSWNDSYQNKIKVDAKLFAYNLNNLNPFEAYVIGIPDSIYEKLTAIKSTGFVFKNTNDLLRLKIVTADFYAKIQPSLYVYNPEHLNFKKKVKRKLDPYDKRDLNKVTALELKNINGIGPILSKRIVKYRRYLKGFSDPKQLNEVWGLDIKVVNKVLDQYEIKTIPKIQKISVNRSTLEELKNLPYIDFVLAKQIRNFVEYHGPLQTIEDLKQIPDFPIEKYQRIILYLQL